MDKTPTKDRILDSALTLFSEKGYDGVGVDLIAENAGIKGPSLYKHFKGKEDILETLIEKAESYYEACFGSVNNPGKTPSSMEELVTLSLKRIQFTLSDPMIKKSDDCLLWSSSAITGSHCSPQSTTSTACRECIGRYSRL